MSRVVLHLPTRGLCPQTTNFPFPARRPERIPHVYLTHAAFSLAEIVVTIGILAIIVAIAIQGLSGVNTSARESVARENLALLNRAVLHFNQAMQDITLNADPSSTQDELAIVRALQWRDTNIPGSPYLTKTFATGVSSNSSDYRIQWNGRMFELIMPGMTGSGLKTGLASPEGGDDFLYPADYDPLQTLTNE